LMAVSTAIALKLLLANSFALMGFDVDDSSSLVSYG
jgi:hypothetical protein